MSESPPRVVAVVLNYNGRDVTLQTLASLFRLDYPALELVVVDNGSSDGSREAIAAAHPGLTQLRVEENRGIANGLDRGVAWALERGADYVLVLNNDIEVDPAMVDEMVRAAEADPTIGIVGPKAYYFWDRQRIWSAGGRLMFRETVTRERGMGAMDRGQFDEPGEVDYINGCAALVRASALREVGLFDPIYVVSVEDADWCVRAKRAGYRCWYEPRARLWHMVSHTTGGYSAGRTFHTGRSTAIFVRRYAGPLQWCSFLLFMSMAFPVALLRELARGNQAAAWAKLKGVIAGLEAPLAPPPRWEANG